MDTTKKPSPNKLVIKLNSVVKSNFDDSKLVLHISSIKRK